MRYIDIHARISSTLALDRNCTVVYTRSLTNLIYILITIVDSRGKRLLRQVSLRKLLYWMYVQHIRGNQNKKQRRRD